MTSLDKLKKSLPSVLMSLLIAIGFLLTAVSWFKLCTTSCNDAHNYRLFGLPFEAGGVLFFSLALLLFFFSRQSPILLYLLALLLASGLGAEGYFIYLQKAEIGSYCPVCLSIATTILLMGICLYFIIKKEKVEVIMRGWLRVGLLPLVFILGFTGSFLGVTKIDQLQAVEDKIKDQIKFGNRASPIEVYVFTDWACPACRAIEPQIEAMAPKITKEATLTFVDTVVHPETLNYAPYNLSFMVNNKLQYFQIRDALSKLSVKTKKPTDQDIANAVAPLGVRFKELPYEDVTVAMRYFDELVTKFKVTGTPTVAIVNRDAKKGKKLSGVEEITEANVLKAINSLR